MQTELEKKKEELLILCQKGLIEKNLYQNQTYRDRLKAEVREVSNQNEYDYFLDLVKNKTKYPSNQNNILIPFLQIGRAHV